jgi:poly(beta-D-mannuronate) lyase
MKDINRFKKLTRRGFLAAVAAGAAGFGYLESQGRRPAPAIVRPVDPLAAPVVPVIPGFVPIAVKPSQVLDLADWKLNLPEHRQQVTQPALTGFSDEAFRVVEAVQFSATCGGEPEPGSQFPRSELREMNADGSLASWSTTSGEHQMDLTQRVTHLPLVQPKLVCGQIHGVATYLILVVLDGQRLYVKYKNAVVGVLDRDYQLGTYFALSVQARRGYVDIFYNGAHLVHQAMVEDQCYFKAGCYLQSNTSLGDLPTAYGQVEITSLVLTHS